MKNRFLYIFIALIFVVITVSPYSVFALVKSDDGEAVLLQEGRFDIPESEIDSVNDTRAASAVETVIYNGLISCSSGIDISSYRVSISNLASLYSNVINDNPDLFYVSSSYEYNYYSYNNTVANIFPEYTMTSSEIQQAKTVFDNGVERALSFVDDSMSDLQKATVLHDYVCSLAHYPQVDLNTDDKPEYHSAYGFFYNSEVVCAGYTLVYSYLLNEVGVPCEYVSSDDMVHAWNKVQIGGNWYNVDCTWDDLDYDCSVSIQGSMSHIHFLRSDTEFATQQCSFHYGGQTYDNCSATDATYDTAFWDNVTSFIWAVNGDFYYLKYTTSPRRVTLTRRTDNGTESSIKAYTSVVGSTYSTYVYDQSGNPYVNSFSVALAKIAYLDNRFYIYNSKRLDSVSLIGVTYVIENMSDYVSGLFINEDRNLVYQGYSDSDTVVELDKLEYYNQYFTTEKGSNYNNYPDINYDLVINAKDYAMIIKRAV